MARLPDEEPAAAPDWSKQMSRSVAIESVSLAGVIQGPEHGGLAILSCEP